MHETDKKSRNIVDGFCKFIKPSNKKFLQTRVIHDYHHTIPI